MLYCLCRLQLRWGGERERVIVVWGPDAASLRLWLTDWLRRHVVATTPSPTGQLRTKPFLWPLSTALYRTYWCVSLCKPLWPDPNGLTAASWTPRRLYGRTWTGLAPYTFLIVLKCAQDSQAERQRCWAVPAAEPGRGSAASCWPPSPKQSQRLRRALDFAPRPRYKDSRSRRESAPSLSRRFTTSLPLMCLRKR